MSTPSTTRRARLGLAAKLFAILLLLGAVAVLITGGLGYMRAREALEQTIFDQLTSARETKSRQLEIYFRAINNDMRLLARSKMVVEAMHAFRDAVGELDTRPVPEEVRRRVDGWYEGDYMPTVRRLLGTDAPVKDYLPVTPSAYFMQDWYIVSNPNPPHRLGLLDDAGDGGRYSREHALYHPLLRTAAATLGFYDLYLVGPRTGRVVHSLKKEADFGTSLKLGPYRTSNLAAAAARCSASADPSATCLEDFADYTPSNGAPSACTAGRTSRRRERAPRPARACCRVRQRRRGRRAWPRPPSWSWPANACRCGVRGSRFRPVGSWSRVPR